MSDIAIAHVRHATDRVVTARNDLLAGVLDAHVDLAAAHTLLDKLLAAHRELADVTHRLAGLTKERP